MNFEMFSAIVSIMMITLTTSSAIGRGLSLPPLPGSAPPRPPPGSTSINANLTSDFLLTTLGVTGSANSNQQVSESVIGNSQHPATVVSSSSNSAGFDISGTTHEVAVVEVPEASVSTLNLVQTEVIGSGSENLEAAAHGINASIGYLGESAVPLGGGNTYSNAETEVEIMLAVQ